MPNLTVRNIPEDVMESLRDAARAQNRSINGQAIHWLQLEARQWGSLEERMQLLRRIEASQEATFRRHGLGSDSGKLIRQMRDERARRFLRRPGR